MVAECGWNGGWNAGLTKAKQVGPAKPLFVCPPRLNGT